MRRLDPRRLALLVGLLSALALAITQAAAATVDCAPTTMTRFASSTYSYDRVGHNAQATQASLSSPSVGTVAGAATNVPQRSGHARFADLLAAEDEADLAGIVYRRTDLNGGKHGGKPYVGQAKSAERFIARQAEHARANPDADFEFEILSRAEPGTELDRLEEYWIRELGGPTNKGNPGGLLANARHQMGDPRYQAAGGSPFP